MNPCFRITVGSEPESEELVGDLYCDDQIVCVLTPDEGSQHTQMRLFGPPDGGAWSFLLADFEQALTALKLRMWELRRNVPPSR